MKSEPSGEGPRPQPDAGGRSRLRGWSLGCIGAVAGLIIIIVIISVAMSGTDEKTTPTTPAATPPSVSTTSPSPTPTTPSQPTEAATTVSGDGQYVVGTDIQPGTYRTDGPSDSSLPNCYWERAKDAKGELGSIIANGNPTGSAVVSIQPTDKLFKSQGCKDWVKIGQ